MPAYATIAVLGFEINATVAAAFTWWLASDMSGTNERPKVRISTSYHNGKPGGTPSINRYVITNIRNFTRGYFGSRAPHRAALNDR